MERRINLFLDSSVLQNLQKLEAGEAGEALPWRAPTPAFFFFFFFSSVPKCSISFYPSVCCTRTSPGHFWCVTFYLDLYVAVALRTDHWDGSLKWVFITRLGMENQICNGFLQCPFYFCFLLNSSPNRRPGNNLDFSGLCEINSN